LAGVRTLDFFTDQCNAWHRFTAKYKFAKPNDRRALDLMNAAAEAVMKELPDLCLAYGNSDEFR
jgi:tRNA(His) 5'-end guanylyltransferase